MKIQKILTSGDAKTSKGEKLGYFTGIIYLSPASLSGKNFCSFASPECIQACLNTAGHGIFSTVQAARYKKSRFFIEQKNEFLEQLKLEIGKLFKNKGTTLAIRLNGTSDLPWENIKLSNGLNIFETYPTVQFYDYTKSFKRVLENKLTNYHLTFSRSELSYNHYQAGELIKQGKNVAVVFSETTYNEVVKLGKIGTTEVVDGDVSDLRFLDGTAKIVALKAKGAARKMKTGFVVDNLNDIWK